MQVSMPLAGHRHLRVGNLASPVDILPMLTRLGVDFDGQGSTVVPYAVKAQGSVLFFWSGGSTHRLADSGTQKPQIGSRAMKFSVVS